ncbi:MAG: DUF927 domain-containing protein [Pseudomonadota bacterium]|nr:DUF927 domain-containing protein [Pseudomonadota bacterium]
MTDDPKEPTDADAEWFAELDEEKARKATREAKGTRPDHAKHEAEPDPQPESNGQAQQANDNGGTRQNVVSLDEAREARKARARSFRMDDLGLGQKQTKGSGKNKDEFWAHISPPFEIVGEARNPHGVNWGRYLRWRDSDGRLHERFVSNALLAAPARLYALLAYDGLKIEPDRARALARYLAVAETAERVTIVSRTGWYEIDDLRVFVLPKETVGPKDASRVILDQAAHAPYDDRGSIKAWQESVARPASGHALAVFAISTALAGPLLDLAGLEGGGVHVFGPSSLGKTTLLRLAASVWGGPSFVRSWRATANGLEGAAAGSSDTLLALDELSQVETREVASSIYQLANGTGKARAGRDGALREPKTWRVMSLSSGEHTAETKLREDRGRKPRAGQAVRMLDVPADRGKGFGCFDHAGPEGDAGKLAKAFKHAAASYFGIAGPEFVRRLIAKEVTGEDVRRLIEEFIRSNVKAGSDGQIDRAAQRLGLIAVAGELAIAAELVPWKEGEAHDAASWAFDQWIALRGGTEAGEVSQAIDQVRLFMSLHGESRFDPLLGEVLDRPVSNRAGWRRDHCEKREWLVLPEVWKFEVCAGLDPTFVAKTLAKHGMLRPGKGQYAASEKIGGKTKRVYVLKANILEEGHDNAP